MTKYGLALFVILQSFFCIAAERVLIITHAFNEPNFIEWQHKTFKKFIKDEYEFVVFNDANDPIMCRRINNVCNQCGVRCMRVPQEIHDQPYLKREPGESYHNPNVRHMNCVQYSLNSVGFEHDGILVFIDSDMFVTRPLSINDAMIGYDIVAVGRSGGHDGVHIGYLWPGLCFLRMSALPDKRTLNFNCGKIDGVSVDSGGYSYYYLKAHPEIKNKNIDEVWGYQLFCPDRFVPSHLIKTDVPEQEKIFRYAELGFTEKEIKFLLKQPHTIQFLLNNSILHYRAGSNYDGQSQAYMVTKRDIIHKFLEDVTSDN